MFQQKDFSNLKILKINQKKIFIIDKHQYSLPIWGYFSNKNNKSYTLVSIDYHPDTNPPFLQSSQYQASLKHGGEKLINKIINKKINSINKYNIENLIKKTDNLSNDEHINTAIRLKYLNDYHMINCMDKHNYSIGRHYLLKEKFFSRLDDQMFNSINFKIPKKDYILDIDLDFFLDKKSLYYKNKNYIFNQLVRKSKFITIARSKKYFNYLKKENFTIKECENLLINLIKKIVRSDYEHRSKN